MLLPLLIRSKLRLPNWSQVNRRNLNPLAQKIPTPIIATGSRLITTTCDRIRERQRVELIALTPWMRDARCEIRDPRVISPSRFLLDRRDSRRQPLIEATHRHSRAIRLCGLASSPNRNCNSLPRDCWMVRVKLNTSALHQPQTDTRTDGRTDGQIESSEESCENWLFACRPDICPLSCLCVAAGSDYLSLSRSLAR